ncbi:uncharacterized protein RCH25_038734 [Pelodytes ibericus]
MTSEISRFCYILFFSMATLHFVKAELETSTAVTSVTLPDHQSVSLQSTEYVSPITNTGTTLTPVRDTKTTANTSNNEEITTALNTPGLSVVTTGMPETEGHTSVNGPVESTNFTTTAPSNSQSSATISLSWYTTNSSKENGSTMSTLTQEFSISPNNTASQNITAATSTKGTFTANMSSDTIFSSLKHPEAILTSIFSTVLAVVILAVVFLTINKYRKRRSQYSHHPLHENHYESADIYSAPDDTLVISGGLYDAPRVYNPNMTVLEDEESQHDYVSFSSRPGQFRLEFLPGDKEMDMAYDSSFPGLSHSLRRNM